jgi:hypothetical protein
MRHDIDFGRGDPLPLCRRCEQPINGEQWAAMEECPGPQAHTDALSMYAYLVRGK